MATHRCRKERVAACGNLASTLRMAGIIPCEQAVCFHRRALNLERSIVPPQRGRASVPGVAITTPARASIFSLATPRRAAISSTRGSASGQLAIAWLQSLKQFSASGRNDQTPPGAHRRFHSLNNRKKMRLFYLCRFRTADQIEPSKQHGLPVVNRGWSVSERLTMAHERRRIPVAKIH